MALVVLLLAVPAAVKRKTAARAAVCLRALHLLFALAADAELALVVAAVEEGAAVVEAGVVACARRIGSKALYADVESASAEALSRMPF